MSPALVPWLQDAGHDAVHVKQYGMAAERDEAVIDRARVEERVVITYDLDFPRIMALLNNEKPSRIIFRAMKDPVQQIASLLSSLRVLQVSLEEGCIAVIEPDRLRIRSLPLNPRG